MIGSSRKNLKEEIIELLLKKPASSKNIRTQLKHKDINVTVQAVYKQLNTLLESEVILKNKKEYLINNEWIKNISKIIDIQDIELPEEGEKFTYKFNSLQNLDAHWKHMTEAFNKILGNEPMFLYSYHQFWIYTPTREESERKFAGEFLNKKQYTFYVIGGVTDLDKKYRNSFKDSYYKVENYSIKSLKEKEHILVIGQFIINVRVPDDITKEIDSIYKTDKDILNKEQQLKELLSENHKSMFTIENNLLKANKIKRKIAQPFALPLEIKQKIK
ncbi:hypothetical protein CL684_02010 [Candidatus Campbellbacteria bacterium]|nr:hypothetical protein [Candidatus Campbellbacteria bacterium]|tara:strand:+ start:5700 stop:6521 length:822 start_codon:yes stop_codon:yes gene_type:complete